MLKTLRAWLNQGSPLLFTTLVLGLGAVLWIVVVAVIMTLLL